MTVDGIMIENICHIARFGFGICFISGSRLKIIDLSINPPILPNPLRQHGLVDIEVAQEADHAAFYSISLKI